MRVAKGEAEPLMSPQLMKSLLMLSKKEPVSCAIGLSKDKTGLILLDKKAKPQKLVALLKKKASASSIEVDTGSIRFGHAMVDTDEDSQLVQFVVNKDASGATRPKVLELLKKAGFGKCEIRVDAGLEDEPAGDDTSEEDAGEARPAAPEAPAAAGNSGAAEAAQRLTGLVKRMIGALGSNPAGADAMKTAAKTAQAALKAGDVAAATGETDTLERLLNAMPAAPGAGPAASGPPPGSPVFTKARATWVATRRKVESELDKLHAELQAIYKGHGVVADLEKTFRSKVEPMMEKFDESLAHKLDEVAQNADAAAHAKLVEDVKGIIGRYEAFLGSDPLIRKLDDNPFVPLSIEKTLTASLTALAKVVA